MTASKELHDRAEQIQQEFYDLIKKVRQKSKPSVKYADIFNTVLFLKLAELELRISDLVYKLHESK